jgi:TM2 domain-containing membrane protein YozV
MAAVLNFFFPGVGHMYAGHIFQGLIVLVLIPALYFAAIPTVGLALLLAIPLHIFIMIDAQRAVARGKKKEMAQLARMIRQGK